MFGIGLPEIVVLVLLVAGLAWLVVRVASRPAEPHVESRRIAVTRTVGVLVGLAAAWWTALLGTLGTGVTLAPTVFGTCVVVAMTVGETLVRPPREAGPRTASLRPRRVRDYAPTRLLLLVGLQLTALVALLVFTTVTTGRTDGRTLGCATAVSSQAAGPYPGVAYSLPLGLALALLLAVAAVGARSVVRRPRGNGPAGTDDELRRRSLGVLVAATGVALATSYVGLALTAGSALGNLGTASPTCAPEWMRPVGIAVSLTALPAVVLALGCLVLLFARRTAPAAARHDTAAR